MSSSGFQARLGVVLFALYALLWVWQTPGTTGSRLRPAEIDTYMQRLATAPFPESEREPVLERLRAWALADDGKPVYMLNLMRYYPELRHYPGAPEFSGTPQESNAHYEDAVLPLALRLGSYPLLAGEMQGANLLEHAPALDDWGRLIVMRYPSRRAVLELFSHPDYLPYMPYKLMALQVVLTPVHTDIYIPDLRWLAAGVFLVTFLAAGWWRAARSR